LNLIINILLVYLFFSVAYLLIFAIASVFPLRRKTNKANKQNTFAILIPAYKENIIIRSVAKSAYEHNYPKSHFQVFVIADSLNQDTIDYIKNIGIDVIEVSFESSTKAKSLNAALEIIPAGKFDYTVILDVDNIMAEGFLDNINDAINCGYKVVQGHRTAKNTNTATAYLDAASEEIANSIYRKGHRNIGLSAMLIGSAFAIEWNLFKRLMHDIRNVAGEDRELEIRLLADRITIEYAEDAIVLDEKVENWELYTRQRTRWAAAHLDFFAKYFFPSIAQLFKGNFDYVNKIWHTAIPPRIILLALLIFSSLITFILLVDNYQYFAILLLVNIITIVIAVPHKFYNYQFLRSLIQLPIMFFSMIAAWSKIKGQKDKFLHTPHTFKGEEK